ncbi:MAG: PIG-L deacetylase family protein [Acidimicrobiales bacterium]
MTGTIDAPLPTPAVALAIAAHPDDVEFWCGATLARWSSAGCVVHHLICTDGSKGTWDVTADQAALVERRQAEQRDAAAALGATGEVVFLGAVDGELVADRATTSAVSREIRRLRPTVVLGHDPWKRYRLHPDHRAAGFLTVDAVVAARDPHFFPEHGIAHHRPDALLLFEADEANHLEPADETSIAAKLAALEAHRSQLETTHFYALDGDADPLDGFRARERQKMADAATALGAAAAYGEAFHLMEDL